MRPTLLTLAVTAAFSLSQNAFANYDFVGTEEGRTVTLLEDYVWESNESLPMDFGTSMTILGEGKSFTYRPQNPQNGSWLLFFHPQESDQNPASYTFGAADQRLGSLVVDI